PSPHECQTREPRREGLLRRALVRRHHRALRHEAAEQCARHGRPLRGARAAMMRRPHPASAARLVPPEAMRPHEGPVDRRTYSALAWPRPAAEDQRPSALRALVALPPTVRTTTAEPRPAVVA